MIVCFLLRMLSSWSFVVVVASDKSVSNAIQPADPLLAGWSASWYTDPLSYALCVVLDTAIKRTVIDHHWISMIGTFWKYIPPFSLESVILILWNAAIHAKKAIVWYSPIMCVDCLHCVHDMLRCCCCCCGGGLLPLLLFMLVHRFDQVAAMIRLWSRLLFLLPSSQTL